jgi:hypothetical protein
MPSVVAWRWSEAKRLKALEDPNPKLTQPLAEQVLDAAARCGSCFQKNGSARRQARRNGAAAGQAGPVGTGLFDRVGADRSMVRYRPRGPADTGLRVRLRELAVERWRLGYRHLFVLLRREGECSGINHIHRLYRKKG